MTRPARFAVPIDADNVPPRVLPSVIRDIKRLGSVAVCRVFGDLPKARRPRWKAAVEDGGLPSPRLVNRTGRNAADIALMLEAVELACGGGLDGLCLLSSDGDFAELVRRLRARGLEVHVFGQQAAKSLRRAANAFHFTAAPSPRDLQAPPLQ